MLAKTWKKIGLIILIILCMYNVMSKIVRKVSFDEEMESTAIYYNELKKQEEAEKKEENNSTGINFNNLFTNFNTIFEN